MTTEMTSEAILEKVLQDAAASLPKKYRRPGRHRIPCKLFMNRLDAELEKLDTKTLIKLGFDNDVDLEAVRFYKWQ